jgi:hypothetical protein
MSNPWVEHVRKYAKDNNITYMCAITEASKTYKKTKATPKMTTKPQPKPPPKPPPKPQPKVVEEEDVDIISNELQQLMFASGNEKIKKALAKMNYKGRFHANPMLRNLQILQNLNSTKQMKDLIKELKKK